MAIMSRTVKNRRDANGLKTDRPGTVYDVNIQYMTHEGRKTYNKKGFATKKEAAQHESEMRTKLAKPGYEATSAKESKQFLAHYLTDWLERYGTNNLRPNTLSGYKTNIFKHIIPEIGSITLQDLSGRNLDDLYTRLLAKGLAMNTVKYVHRTLSVAMEHARRYHLIENNPAKDILTRFQSTVEIPDPYDVKQMQSLLKSAVNTRWELIIILAGLYGMRRNEVLGLKWKHVDFEEKTFEIVTQLATPKMITDNELSAPLKESFSVRTLPITIEVEPIFRRQYDQMKINEESPDYAVHDLVICHPNGKPLSASHVSREFNQLLVKIKMPHIRFHDLRHSAATNMHELSGDFFTVGDILGHSLKGVGIQLGIKGGLEAVTERYIDVRIERKRIVLEKYHRAVLKPKKREMER